MSDFPTTIDEACGKADPRDDLAEQLLLSRFMQVEQRDAQTAIIYLRSTGARVRIPTGLYQQLLEFETPRSLRSVAGGEARIATALERLRASGFLVAEQDAERPSPQRLVTDAPVRLFDCPAHKLKPAQTDVVVLGVPYDLGDSAAAGTRDGPAALREASFQTLYGIDRRTGQPLGWFDADRALPILRGVTIGDCGDVFVDHGAPQAQLFARITAALAAVAGGGSLPLLLGGDATICFPAIELLQARRPIAVVRIGNITAGVATTQDSFVSPQTLPEHILRLPGVDHYVQVGAGKRDDYVPPGFATVAAAAFRRVGIAALVPYLADRQTIHLGIDMNALAVPGGDAVDGPEPEHLSYGELHALLCGIGDRYAIASMDVVGLNPLTPGWRATANAALHLLLTGLSAARDRTCDEPQS
ncbi:MAG: arginase family protein [Pseudomonadota bacterium]|nr:arginase family protein [Pseudomonadota bacterium]